MQLNKIWHILLILIGINTSINAQTFYKVFGTMSNDYAKSVVMDRDSGYAIVGGTDGTGNGLMDAYLLKLDTSGNLIYSKTFGGIEIDWFTDIKVNSAGFVITGYSNSFGLDYDIYVVQTDPQGELIWEKTIGGSAWDFSNAIAITTDGNYIVAGESYSFSNGMSDGYVAKVNNTGDILWTQHFGGLYKDWFNDVVINDANEIILCGATTNTDLELDAWLVKLDENGTLLWQQTMGDTLDDELYGLTLMDNGDIESTGYNTYDGLYNKSGFHYRHSTSGTYLYGEGFFGNNPDYSADIVHYPNTNEALVAISSTSYGLGQSDVYLDMLDQHLLPNYNIHFSFGTFYDDLPVKMDTTFDKGFVIVGTTTYTQFGNISIFINKIDNAGNSQSVYVEQGDLGTTEISNNKLDFWPNPAKNRIQFSNETYNNTAYTIYSLEGKIVQSGSVSNAQINLHLTSGIYTLAIDNHVVEKLVIEH